MLLFTALYFSRNRIFPKKKKNKQHIWNNFTASVIRVRGGTLVGNRVRYKRLLINNINNNLWKMLLVSLGNAKRTIFTSRLLPVLWIGPTHWAKLANRTDIKSLCRGAIYTRGKWKNSRVPSRCVIELQIVRVNSAFAYTAPFGSADLTTATENATFLPLVNRWERKICLNNNGIK